MPFLKFEERNDVFGKTALFSLKIFSNREKEVIVFNNLSTISKIVSFMYFSYLFENGQNCFVPKTDFSSFESNYFLISI